MVAGERGRKALTAAAAGAWPVLARAQSRPRPGTPGQAGPNPQHTHRGPPRPAHLSPLPDPAPGGTPLPSPARAAYLASRPAPSLSPPRRPPARGLPAPRPGCSAGSASRAALGAPASPWRPGGCGGGLVARQATRRGSRGGGRGVGSAPARPYTRGRAGPPVVPQSPGRTRQIRAQTDADVAGAAAQGAEGREGGHRYPASWTRARGTSQIQASRPGFRGGAPRSGLHGDLPALA